MWLLEILLAVNEQFVLSIVLKMTLIEKTRLKAGF
jgi:hypothetical protein